MQIRFVSSLTSEDERRLAQTLVACISALLGQFPVAYSLRVETADGDVFDHSDAPAADATAASRSRMAH